MLINWGHDRCICVGNFGNKGFVFPIPSIHKTIFYVAVREFEFLSHCIVEPGFVIFSNCYFLSAQSIIFSIKKNVY